MAACHPKKVLTLKEFLSSLNDKNPYYKHVVNEFIHWRYSIKRIYKKDQYLYDIVMESRSLDCLPVIDKYLQVVIEADSGHEQITAALFCYNYSEKGEDPSEWDKRIWWDLYHKFGYGYSFTGAYGNSRSVIITMSAYKPDKFDKDLLIELGFK